MTFKFGIITLFPEMFDAITKHGITSRALQQAIYDVQFWNPRDYTTDNHKTVDDRPYGGGPGMVMLVEPVSYTHLDVYKRQIPSCSLWL